MTKIHMTEPICYANVVDIESYKESPRVNRRIPGAYDVPLYTKDQAEAYADARVREALGKLDDQIDLQCSKLQTDDETHDFWMGVGAAVTVAQNVIADSMPDDK